jgi:hypothetical protein
MKPNYPPAPIFEGCAFVFTPHGACSVESPYLLRWDNFAGVDPAVYLFTMKAAVVSSNVIPFVKGWRDDRRKLAALHEPFDADRYADGYTLRDYR